MEMTGYEIFLHSLLQFIKPNFSKNFKLDRITRHSTLTLITLLVKYTPEKKQQQSSREQQMLVETKQISIILDKCYSPSINTKEGNIHCIVESTWSS